MIKIIAHDTDMTIPIYNSLYFKKKLSLKTKEIDLNKLNNLDFRKVDCKKFPLINILSQIYPNKNLVYIGSDCFKMFGVYSKGMPYSYYDDAIKENWIEVVEELPEGCKNHPEPKYWK